MKQISLILMLLTFSVAAFCQQYQYGKVLDSTYYNPGWGDMDYAVPESPAFKILGTNPDNILHPTSAKAVALSIGDYFLTSGATIPKSLAVQFSPWLLANRNTSLNEYNKNGWARFISRASFSVGTSNQGNAYNVAEGLNLTILDKSDLKSTKHGSVKKSAKSPLNKQSSTSDSTTIPALDYHDYLVTLANLARADVDFHRQAIDLYLKAHPKINMAILTPLLDDSTTAEHKAVDSIAVSLGGKSGKLDQLIVKYRDSVKNADWNAAIWQIGIATLQSSPDSLVKGLQFSQVAFWSSTALPLGQKAQFLFGGKLGFVDSINWYTNYSVGARFFYGKNSTKAFLQGEFDHKDSVNSWTITAGCQFNISNGIWGQFAINLVIMNGGKVSYQPGFNIGLGKQEKKK